MLFQRQRQTQTDLIVDRQFNSGFLHQSPRRDKICSHVRNDMEDSTLMSPLGCTASGSTHSWEKNVIANQLSRGCQIPKMTEWSLNQDVFQQLFRVYSTPNIDLFATKENGNWTVFCSPFPDPLAWRCDGLVVEECLHMYFRRQYCFRRPSKQWTNNLVFSLLLHFHQDCHQVLRSTEASSRLSNGTTSNNELVIAKKGEFIHDMWW